MNFKDALNADIIDAFLNESEFAEIMNVDGQDIATLWEEENMPLSEANAWGINVEGAVLLIAENAMPLPVPGQCITVNEQGWIVRKAIPQQGILRLELTRNTS